MKTCIPDDMFDLVTDNPLTGSNTSILQV